MTEQTKTAESTEVKVEEKKEEVVVNESEVKAKEGGWLPEEDWVAAGKDPSKWRPAKEYNDRGELFSEIDRLKKELTQTNKALGSLKTHHVKVRDTAYKEAYKTLKEEMDAAKKNEDSTRVLEIRDNIDELKKREAEEKAELQNVPTEPVIIPEFVEWHSNNSWYKLNGKDPMSVFANSEARDYITEKMEGKEKFSNKEVYDYVDKRMRDEFPEKFKNPKRQEPSKVEGGGSDGRSNLKTSSYKLSEVEEKICRDLVKSGVMTRDQYIKDLEKYSGRD